MQKIIQLMLKRLGQFNHSGLISWASPVPSFGNIEQSSIATLGINPSNREFVDSYGLELTGQNRRFHTLKSLNLNRWSQAGSLENQQISDSCIEYFFRNPYDRWFKKLDTIIADTGTSYYDRFFPACHIDLIPFATGSKWAEIPTHQRNHLLSNNRDLLISLLRTSNIDCLILNGQSVVREFQLTAEISLTSKEMKKWSLPRKQSEDVPGFSYTGTLSSIAGSSLAKDIKILGFNHNIQSSFGVTKTVVSEIKQWIGKQSLTSNA